MTEVWTNPKVEFCELLMLYDKELQEFMEDHENEYDPKRARTFMLKFFDQKGEGTKMRSIMSRMGI